MCVAWLPKATVQAAVGGSALDLMRERSHGAEAEERGSLVLVLSVVIILLTAPVGALGIALAGPAWLSHDGARADQGGELKVVQMAPQHQLAVGTEAPSVAVAPAAATQSSVV